MADDRKPKPRAFDKDIMKELVEYLKQHVDYNDKVNTAADSLFPRAEGETEDDFRYRKSQLPGEIVRVAPGCFKYKINKKYRLLLFWVKSDGPAQHLPKGQGITKVLIPGSDDIVHLRMTICVSEKQNEELARLKEIAYPLS